MPKIALPTLFLVFVGSACGATAKSTVPTTPTEAKLSVVDAKLPYAIIGARNGREVSQAEFWQRVKQAQAICVGESHDNPHHHWTQLAVVTQVAANGGEFATGMEMFQRPFQGVLDDFAEGTITEEQMRTRTDWKRRWTYDWELYAPMVRHTVEKGGVILALNISKEVKDTWKKSGLAGLSESERANFPELKMDDEQHRKWFRALMENMGSGHGSDNGGHALMGDPKEPAGHQHKAVPKAMPPGHGHKGGMPPGHGHKGGMPKGHGHKGTSGPDHKGTPEQNHKGTPEHDHKGTPEHDHKGTPEHGHKGTPDIPNDDVHAHLRSGHGAKPKSDFIDKIYPVQVLWDETMADTASKWVLAKEGRQIVILAGHGHCHESGIIRRMQRRGVKRVISVRPVVETGGGEMADLLTIPENDFLFVLDNQGE